MAFFIPASAGFKASTLDRNELRYWKLLIDIDDDTVLEDVTEYISNNSLSVSGKRSGSNNEAVSNTASVTLRNSGQWFHEGDFAGALCAIEAKIGEANEYIRVFTGRVDDQGCKRDKRFLNGDTVQIGFVDYTKKAAKRKATPIILTGFKVCDTVNTSSSLVHELAGQLGLTASDLDVHDISDIVPWVYLDSNKKIWEELQKLAAQYLGLLTFRYDGKLRFSSRFEDAYSEPVSEYTFDDLNIHAWSAEADDVICTRAKTEFNEYSLVGDQVIFRDTTGYNSYTKQIEIEVASGAYYPGDGATDVAELKYADPTTGEEFAYCTDIDTPTIGDVGSGANIECEGGTLTLTSFNGSTAATNAAPDHAEIILYNGTGSTITIRKLEITGTAYAVEKSVTVIDEDNSVDEDDVVEKTIDGTYAANSAQAHETTEWWVEWGKEKRMRYSVTTDWLPFVQEGALVTWTPPGETTDMDCIVDSYTHPAANGPMTKQVTNLVLVEKMDYTPAGGGRTNTGTSGGDASNVEQAEVSTETYNYRNNVAPTNNVDDLNFSYTPNADGSINVDVSFSYTQGLVPAIGFLGFYKVDTDAPEAIDLDADPNKFKAASSDGTSYTMTFEGLPARFGGAGAVTRHYRFGLVAVSSCIGGMIPNSGGVVEDADWIDKTFAPRVEAVEGDVAMSIEGSSIVWRRISTGIEVSRIQYDGLLDLLKVSKLAALVNYKGTWNYDSTLNAEIISEVEHVYAINTLILLSNGNLHCVYIYYDGDYKIFEAVRDVSGTWSTPIELTALSVNYNKSAALLPDNSILFVYSTGGSPNHAYEVIRDSNGSYSAPVDINDDNVFEPKVCTLSDGKVFCVHGTTNAIYEKIRDGYGIWGTSVLIEDTTPSAYYWLTIIADSDDKIYCAYTDINEHLRFRTRATNGVWSASEELTTSQVFLPSLELLPDGSVMCAYKKSDNSFVYKIMSTAGVWGSEVVVNASIAGFHTFAKLLDDGSILYVYINGDSNDELAEKQDSSSYGSFPIKPAFTLVGGEIGVNDYGEYTLYPDGRLHMTGWGYVTWTSGVASVSKTLTLPYEVSDPKLIRPTGNCLGYKTTNPIAVNDVTGQYGLVVHFLIGASTTQITIIIEWEPALIYATNRVLYSFNIDARWS